MLTDRLPPRLADVAFLEALLPSDLRWPTYTDPLADRVAAYRRLADSVWPTAQPARPGLPSDPICFDWSKVGSYCDRITKGEHFRVDLRVWLADRLGMEAGR